MPQIRIFDKFRRIFVSFKFHTLETITWNYSKILNYEFSKKTDKIYNL